MSRSEPKDPGYKVPGFREAHLEVCKAYRSIDESSYHRLATVKNAAEAGDALAEGLLLGYNRAMAKRRAIARNGGA